MLKLFIYCENFAFAAFKRAIFFKSSLDKDFVFEFDFIVRWLFLFIFISPFNQKASVATRDIKVTKMKGKAVINCNDKVTACCLDSRSYPSIFYLLFIDKYLAKITISLLFLTTTGTNLGCYYG